MSRTINGTTSYLVYDGWNLIAEYAASGTTPTARYIHGANVDEMLARTDTNGTVYYLQDAIGSTISLTDANGAVVENYRYDVYGAPSIYDSSFNLQPSSLASNRFLFTGREWLPDIGLYDYRNRAYSPQVGRFLQTDPIRFDAKDVNIYRYVKNDILNKIDPSGKSTSTKDNPSCIESLAKAVKIYMDQTTPGRGPFNGAQSDKLAHCLAFCEITKGCGGIPPNC